ncbi:MAG: discoidin domain-containing protein [Tolypothrix carrinoi HA7290-LM1]|jgi:hypothetical protein|nr:discoidin domain-containing protein [Tolypothrix carrinoi HA7290-LM1]
MLKINEFPQLTTLADDDLLLIWDNSASITAKVQLSTLKVFLGTSTQSQSVKLTGTAFGATPTYSSSQTIPSAFDGNLSTSYDYAYPDGGYVGLDLGSGVTKKLTKVRVYPRQDGVHERTGGAKIQGSNSQNTGYADLYAFPATPTASTWYEAILNITTAYRYFKYVGANGTYSSVTEIEFYGY